MAWPLAGPWLALGLALAGPWLALGLALAGPLPGPWPGPGWPLAWPWLALGLALGWPGSNREIKLTGSPGKITGSGLLSIAQGLMFNL